MLTTDAPGDPARRALLAGAALAAGIGSFSWDLGTGSLVWDEPLLAAFGYDDGSFGGTIEAFSSRVHPDDLARVDTALQHSISTCGDYHADFRVVRPDGTVRWMSASGAAQGTDGVAQLLVGAATDVTALHEVETRTRGVLESMAVGYLALDADWRITYVNAEGRRVLGAAGPDLVGQVLWEAFPATVGTEFERNYRRAVETGRDVSFDARYPAPLDAWFEVRAVPEGTGLGLYFLDVTARVEAKVASDREARRAGTLARVATELAGSLDPAESLLATLRILVPALADWGIASTLEEGTAHWRYRLHDVASWHPDPAVHELTEEYRDLRVPALTDGSPVGEALATSRLARTDRSGTSRPGQLLAAGPAHQLLTRLDPRDTVVLPLLGRGHVRGLITLVNGADRGLFTDDDVALLRELSAQVGLALDNAHLHAVQRGFAEQLQRDLLSDLPDLPHLELAARYSPAADGAHVGGDWYDAFRVRDGSTCLVIGDVTGHDQRAAVHMAQVRNVLRGVAHVVGRRPAQILAALDLAMTDLAVGALTTALLVTVGATPGTPGTGGIGGADGRTLHWSNAGHLPPVLLLPDGSVQLLDRPHDLLLGLAPETARCDHTVTLPPGATLLLYTDGLVERRGEDLDVGLERLQRTASGLSGRPLEDLCDGLVSALTQDREDDIALLAVRLRPEASAVA